MGQPSLPIQHTLYYVAIPCRFSPSDLHSVTYSKPVRFCLKADYQQVTGTDAVHSNLQITVLRCQNFILQNVLLIEQSEYIKLVARKQLPYSTKCDKNHLVHLYTVEGTVP